MNNGIDPLLYQQVTEFLMHEAELLDTRRFDEWLELLAPELTYRIPVRVTRSGASGEEFADNSDWYKDSRESLAARIKRLKTRSLLAEDPPSRTRHFVSNVRVSRGQGADEFAVKSNLLVFRSRGNSGGHDLFSAERRDVLRKDGANLRLKSRDILLDHTLLDAQDISILL
jgi:3-phenylpropionate/cinnamic acid dioxygenase small subunit